MSYLFWDKKTINHFPEDNISSLYNQGFLFTRTGLGDLDQTRSVRINLEKFKLSSENRRILKKTEDINLLARALPLLDYTWQIGKLGKDFYSTKFGDHIFSANKIKEILTTKHNFNKLFVYKISEEVVGYCVCYENKEILHYCYPFYDLKSEIKNLGMGMMTKAVIWAKENGKKYVYLGSFQRPTDTYKLQFEGLEWFDENVWQTDLEKLKNVL